MTDTTVTYTEYRYYPAAFAVQIVNIIIGVIEAILLIRVVLELLNANAASQFVAWAYSISGALLGPFAGAFPNLMLSGTSVIDVVAILAMIAYAILGWIIVQLLSFIFTSAARV